MIVRVKRTCPVLADSVLVVDCSVPWVTCAAWVGSLEQGLSCAYGARGTSLLPVQKRSTQEKTTPHLALAGHPARQVRESNPGFSTGHPALAKRSRHPCRLPLRGLSSPPHRRTGAPGRAAGHPGPHSVRNRVAVARANAAAPRASCPRNDCRLPAKTGRSQPALRYPVAAAGSLLDRRFPVFGLLGSVRANGVEPG